MRKTVLLSITGLNKTNGVPEDPIRMFTTGYLSGEGDTWKLRYSETSPDDARDRNHITLTMTGGTVTMTNSQQKGADMIFVRGSRYQGVYRTPYGDMDMAVFPSVVQYHIGRNSGEINLSYQLDFDGEYASDRELHILYADKNAGRSTDA